MYTNEITILNNLGTQKLVDLFSYVIGTVWHQLWFLAGEGGLVQNLSLTATDKTRMSTDASDESVAVSGDGETRIWPEFGRSTTMRDFSWTFESNNS